MKILNSITSVLLLGGTILHGQDTRGDANGPNTPVPGDIIPDTVTFAMSPTPAAEIVPLVESGTFTTFTDLENRSYSDFPNEVVVTLYHAPW